jgi:hypothetical protein
MVCILTYELLGKQYSTEKFRSQETALKSIKDTSVESCLCFAMDITETSGHKSFSIVPLDETKTVHNLSSLLTKDNHIYEWLTPSRPVKPYFDLEMEIEGLTLNTSSKLLDVFIRYLCSELNQIFDLHITQNDLIILNSSKIGKLSYHLVINSNIYFENTIQHGHFIKWLNSRFIKPLMILSPLLGLKKTQMVKKNAGSFLMIKHI